MPPRLSQPSPHVDVHHADHLSALVDRLHLPPHITNLARSVLQATSSHPPDPYTAACAVYIASSSHSHSQVPLSTLLNAPGSQLRIPHFFDTAKGIAADAAARIRSHTDPIRIVHLSHRAFMVCADVWRKLHQLRNANLLHNSPHTVRLAWLFFLVCKAHLSSPTDSALAPVSAFHLMLACLVEARLVAVDSPVHALCSRTEAVPAEISRFRQSLKAALPPSLRENLPFYSPHANIPSICSQLTSEYEALLFSAHHRHATDERVFIESPHLLLSPTSDSDPTLHEPVTPTRSPRKRPLDPDVFQTPQKRPTIHRYTMPVTPNRFARHAASPRADDLDALAAVACSTPRPIVRPPRIPCVPPTPMTAGCAAVAWLHKLADSRQETNTLSKLDCPPEDLKPGKDLEAVIDNIPLWRDLVTSVRALSDRLCDMMPELNTTQRRREAMAVYFSATEGILRREACRLAKQREKFTEKLLKNNVFHKSVLTCSWEVTAAAYGRRDMVVFSTAMKAFDLSAFALTKAVESFVIRLPNIPRSLSKHILTCDTRILESLAWRPGSELVVGLKERASVLVAAAETVNAPANKSSSPGEEGKSVIQTESREEVTSSSVKDFALELFYKKLLSIASDRVQELLRMLRMEAIAEAVWSCVKYSVWEKWQLMVDRHLDQIIMCCIYGVSKVRRYQLKFKEIISTYRRMSHTREPSFSHLIPAIFRDLPIDGISADSPSNDEATATEDSHPTRGDIIKFYNQVFIHSMKSHLLKFQVSTPQAEKSSVGNTAPNGTTTVDSHPQSSVEYPLSLTSSRKTGNEDFSQSEVCKDRLSDKVMSSPLRVLRPHASPKRIGRVTVSPMSPGGRLAALRQSPGRKSAMLGSMTPGTRTLYAFGESPVRSLDRINKSLSNETARVRRPVPLNFEGRNAQVRSQSIRRRYADVLGMTGLRTGSTRLVTSGDGKPENDSGNDGQSLRPSSAMLSTQVEKK